MQPYQELLTELKSCADDNYKVFHCKLLKNDNINVLGVRVPNLRKIAKKWAGRIEEVITFPDEFYEVTFLKLTIVSALKYEEFIKYVDGCVALIDNWATCDCFAPKCILKHKEDFLPFIYKYFDVGQEFYQRFALTTLLHFYVESKYLNIIFEMSRRALTEHYYVHMAVAWLIAEVLVKYFDDGIEFLKNSTLDKKTHNKAIQKATESYRLTDKQKNILKGMKK
ncbi:MAG: DNA alkylation repair protein [Clostridia bacterium]|nr:DNA alkylation repair protein [Clostridia bacterium]